jgi:hypothetical protein
MRARIKSFSNPHHLITASQPNILGKDEGVEGDKRVDDRSFLRATDP